MYKFIAQSSFYDDDYFFLNSCALFAWKHYIANQPIFKRYLFGVSSPMNSKQ